MTNETARKKVIALKKRIEALERSFRHNYPNLVCYIDGDIDISACECGYYRDKVNSHKRNIEYAKKELSKLEAYSDKQKTLFK